MILLGIHCFVLSVRSGSMAVDLYVSLGLELPLSVTVTSEIMPFVRYM